MNLQQFVDDYLDAWNRSDTAAVLEFLDKGAAYYDAFLMETCVGKDIAQYIDDSFSDEPFWYRRSGDVIPVENGVVFRYSACFRTEKESNHAAYDGAEVLVLRNRKIITVSDHYCNPDRYALERAAERAEKRHGQPRFAKAGLSALRVSRVRNELLEKIGQEQAFLDSDLTLAQLADQLGYASDHVAQVIADEFDSSFDDFVEEHRLIYAKSLLRQRSEVSDYVFHVAHQAGFKSFTEFSESFRDSFGISPAEYYGKQRNGDDSSTLH